MKRIIAVLLILSALFALSSCSGSSGTSAEPVKESNIEKKPEVKYDVDLTVLSGTMVYAEVYNMMTNPQEYEGKIIKANGVFGMLEGKLRNYYACVIKDATACCSQGLEFVLKGNPKYPDDYPTLGNDITVVGKFETYYEGENRFCQLIDAELIEG